MSSGFPFGSNRPGFGQATGFGVQQTGSITFGTPAVTNTATAPSLFGQGLGGNQPSSGFQFGATTSAPSAGLAFGTSTSAPTLGFKPGPTGLNFGAPASNPNSGFPFNAPATTASAGLAFGTNVPNAGLFGAPAASAPAFGASSTAPTGGLSFGTSLAAPGGLTFGAPTNTQPGLSFGAPASTPGTALSFGAPSSTPATGLTFGTPRSTPATALSFGAPSSIPATGLTFGTPSSAPATGLTFGAPSSIPSTGLTFGAPSSTPATGLTFGAPSGTPVTGLSFGAPTSLSATGLSFGAPTSAPVPGSTFGVPSSIVSTAPIAGLTFGTPSTAIANKLNFGAPTIATGGLNFGTISTSLAPSLSLGVTNTAAPTLSFGTPTTSTPVGFNLGVGTTATSASGGLAFGLGGSSLLKPTTTSAGFSLTQPIATTAAVNIGLGGITTTQPKTAVATSQAEIPLKDQSLPNEILQSVEVFKNFVKEQKQFSSDVARCSIKEFKRVEGDIEIVNNLLKDVESQLQKNRGVAEKLKRDIANGLQNIDMAQRTHDTPPNLQYDNKAPLQFFLQLADNFEREMRILKGKLDSTDKYLKNVEQPNSITSQDLSLGMRRLHETFVSLAGRLQSVHNQVESQKEQYLNLRRYMVGDDTNVFERRLKETEAFNIAIQSIAYEPSKVASGPSPFSSIGSSQAQVLAQKPPPAYPGTTPTGTSVPQASFNTQAVSPFGNTLGTSLSQPGQLFGSASQSGFQLQKPPTGNKRGKP